MAAEDLGFAAAYGPAILSGAAVTLGLTLSASALGTATGIAAAVARRTWPRSIGRLVDVYVEVIRDTPFIIQLFFVFFGLPSVGLQLNAPVAAIATMTLNFGAYATEMVRAGLDAVPAGQREAGQALGLHGAVVFFRIVLPQAIATIFPALLSQVVLVMLDSAVVSQIALRDLTFEADLIQSQTFRAFETYGVTTLIYLGLSFALRRGFGIAARPLLRRTA